MLFVLILSNRAASYGAIMAALPDGEIRRYDRRLNIICRECRKSEVMQRVLAFYQGNFQDVLL
ncbi:hypothetical protein ACN58_20145 [Escherichia coli]|nr:hypothetical protein ACN58_20145 [Escherichia coli]OKT26423.1 hypothetical protein ACN57_05790 [Escherichia coli]